MSWSFACSMEEIKNYLNGKGFTWDMPDQAPIQIEGVFDPVPEITRMERQAAKFISAEEEAEQRKRELNELKMKKEIMMQAAMNLPEEVVNLEDLLHDAEVTTVPAQEIPDEVAVIDSSSSSASSSLSTLGIRPSFAEYKNAFLNASSSVPSTPTPQRKRGSILETTNPALINCLNNMFSPEPNRASIANFPTKSPAGKALPIRRGTMLSPVSAKMTELNQTNDDKKVVKTTRSKLLQSLLGVPSSVDVKTTSKLPGPSFLDQLKARGKQAFGSMASDSEGTNEEVKPKSFLDELKSKCSRNLKSKDDESTSNDAGNQGMLTSSNIR